MFPYDVLSDYSADFASMSFIRECTVGTYVAIAMHVSDVEPKWTSGGEPYLQLSGLDMERSNVVLLRLWRLKEGDIKPGHAYVVRGLKVVSDRVWDSNKWTWIWSTDAPNTIECSARTAWENVQDVEAIAQYF